MSASRVNGTSRNQSSGAFDPTRTFGPFNMSGWVTAGIIFYFATDRPSLPSTPGLRSWRQSDVPPYSPSLSASLLEALKSYSEHVERDRLRSPAISR
jgi:hypothetical protein